MLGLHNISCYTMRFDNIIHISTEYTCTLELRHSLYLDLLTTDPTILNEFSQLNSVTRYLLLLGANMCPFTHDDDLLNMYLKCYFMYIYTCVCLVSFNMYLTWSCFNLTVYLVYVYYTHQHTHAWTHTHANTHILAQTHTHSPTHPHTPAHTHTHAWTNSRTNTHTRTHINTSMSVCPYSYTRSSMYIHTLLNLSNIVS